MEIQGPFLLYEMFSCILRRYAKHKNLDINHKDIHILMDYLMSIFNLDRFIEVLDTFLENRYIEYPILFSVVSTFNLDKVMLMKELL